MGIFCWVLLVLGVGAVFEWAYNFGSNLFVVEVVFLCLYLFIVNVVFV